ncbi:helix-turn-helix domain-containing protein [Micromonospora tarensis]|uniref:Helix-turn-helix domain-containing protein n=1 Tax=Micromonospora tarensis TaxID=2806100 RepID=A0ABS1YG91_9ACTN|nr:helix-turn-helix transcriptional regulator [Micromonospora tarensis]MBM0276387.1 helix-turn-helix domain-containing protein [Micromonospora tarensis]
MVDTFGQVLRSIREAAGLSLSALATRTRYHKSEIGHVETGRRQASPDFAAACDRELGTSPLLSVLLELGDGQGDNVKRRAMLASIGAAATMGGLGLTVLADLVRDGLLDTADGSEDWNATIEAYNRRFVTEPSAEFGRSLLSQLMIARHQIADRGKTPERLRAVAELGQLYGLWLGNQGDVSAARNWYRTAAHLADRSEHIPTRVYVRGRALSRGIYEGYTVQETINGVDETLSLSTVPTLGALEAYSALVHVHALTENLTDGRRAVAGMRRVADGLSDSEMSKVAGPVQRTASFNSYLECRIGSMKEADRAFAEAEPVLRPVPVWLADARIYYGRAMVTHGDTAGGVAFALDAIKRLRHDVRVVGVGVSDLLSAVPAGHRSDELDELRTFAAAGSGPWENLA